MTKVFPKGGFSLPAWLEQLVEPGMVLATEPERMNLAIELSRQQVVHDSGGPFGAVVCELASGKVVGVGVNRVVPDQLSILHAEVMAWSVAQRVVSNFDLAATELSAMALYTSAQPCVACWGGLFWTGIKRLVYAATKADVEQYAGFDEGPLPDDWDQRLMQRGISVASQGRGQAVVVLRDYARKGGVVYNASS